MISTENPESPNFYSVDYLLSHGWRDTGNWQDAYRQAKIYAGEYRGVRIFPAYDTDGKPLHNGSQRILIKRDISLSEPTDIKPEFPQQYRGEFERILRYLESQKLKAVSPIQIDGNEKWFRGTSLAWILYAGYLGNGLLRSFHYDGTILSDSQEQSIVYANDFLKPEKRQKDKEVLERLGLPIPTVPESAFWQPILLGFPKTFSVIKESLAYRSLYPISLSMLSTQSKVKIINSLGLQQSDYLTTKLKLD